MLTGGGQKTYKLDSPIPITGAIQINTTPTNAKIYLDGVECGTTPKYLDSILIGGHTLTLSYQNYKEVHCEKNVEEGQTARVDTTLQDIANITFTSIPSNATLYIDGIRKGVTPYTEEMTAGDHAIRITKEKYQDYTGNVHITSSNPTLKFTLSRQYAEKSAFYLQANFMAGSFMSIGGGIGAFFNNINVECNYMLGMDTSETIWWSPTSSNNAPCGYTYSASSIDARLGYGFILGKRTRLTPQAGVAIVNINAKDKFNEASDFDASKAYAVSGIAALRFDYVLTPAFAVYVSPQYTVAMKKSEYFEAMENVSSKVKGFATGFSGRIGVCVVF